MVVFLVVAELEAEEMVEFPGVAHCREQRRWLSS